MKIYLKFNLKTIVVLFTLLLLISCKETTASKEENTIVKNENKTTILPKKELSSAFKKYWYAGKAEITSYTLAQARYGELRAGNAVLIYVTEPFSAEKQVKADAQNADNISVLKLNSTKNYLTGIYPYAIMTSSFYPVYGNSHALKVAFSAQEWCGQVYAQLNNKENFEITSHSYFESEGDQQLSLEKTLLEDEIWNKIRINPIDLPVGEVNIIPSFEYIRLLHKELKAYKAIAQTEILENGIQSYSISYPELARKLTINFTPEFPYSIESWTETTQTGYGTDVKEITTTAQKNKRIITPYWQQNKNSDLFLRDSLF